MLREALMKRANISGTPGQNPLIQSQNNTPPTFSFPTDQNQSAMPPQAGRRSLDGIDAQIDRLESMRETIDRRLSELYQLREEIAVQDVHRPISLPIPRDIPLVYGQAQVGSGDEFSVGA